MRSIKILMERVAAQMRRYGHTQHDVAMKIGVYESQLSEWLAGKREPSRKNERKLRVYLEEDDAEN